MDARQTGTIITAGMTAFRRSFLHMAGLLAAMSVLLALALWAVLAILVPIVWAQRPTLIDSSSELTLRGAALVALEIGLPVALLGLLSTAVAWGALAKLADDAIAQRSLSIRAALAQGFRRAPALAGTTALVIAGSAVLILLAPFFVVAGILGLLGAPIAAALRNRGSHVRWPAPRTSLLRALPLVEPVRLIVRWGLFIPAASLERHAGLSALARSRQSVAESGPAGLIVIVVTGISFLVIAVAFDAVQRTDAPVAAILALFIVTQVVLTGAPVVILTALFRSVTPSSAETITIADPRLRPRPVMHATAFGLIIALVAAPALLPASSASAASLPTPAAAFAAESLDHSATWLEASPSPSSPDETVTLTAYVSGEEGSFTVPTGSITFSDASGTIDTVTLVDGVASTSITGLADGPHNFTATYSGDGVFAASSDSTFHTVVTATSTTLLESSPSPSDLGESVTLTATVTGGGVLGEPTGSVTFSDASGTIATVTLAGGSASTTLASLAGGSHTFTASYSGDGTFPTSGDSIDHQVVFPGTAVVVTVSPSPSGLGDLATLTAVVSASGGPLVPTGSVTFVDGSIELGTAALIDGTATLTTSALTAGVRTIGANYGGDSSFPSASGSVEHTVRAPVTVTIDGPATSRAGEDVTFTIVATTEPGVTPTGEVTVDDQGTEVFRAAVDGTGTAEFTIALGVGTHTLTATYAGDAVNLPGSSTPFDHSVQKAFTATELASSALPSAEGQPVTFTATVSVQVPGAGLATGTVTFLAGAVELDAAPLDGSGVASFTTDALDVGTTVITARYDGDSSFSTSEDVIPQNVVQGFTATTLETAPATSRIGETVTLTATVTAVAPAAGTPTGVVTFFQGPAALGSAPLNGSGQAALTVSAFGLGTHALAARYGGSTDFASSESVGDHEVTRWPVSIELTPSLTDAVTGQPVTFTVAVADRDGSGFDPTGSITFSEFGITTPIVASLDSAGTATVTVPAPLGRGANALIRAEYSGGTDHAPALTSTNVHVNPGEVEVQLVTVPAAPYYGQTAEVTVTVSPVAPAAGVPRGDFEIFDRGASIRGPFERTGELVSNFLTPRDLGVWTHELSASFDGLGWVTAESPTVDVTVRPAPTELVLSVDPTPSVLDQSVLLTARITVPDGAVPPIGELATFDLGGDVIGTAPFASTAEGHVEATLLTSFDTVGDYALQARFSGPNHEASVSAEVVHSVDGYPTSVSVGSNGPTRPDDPVTVTVLVHALSTLTSPSGTVRLTLDGTLLAGPISVTPDGDGRAIARFDTLPSFPSGTSEVTAIFEPGSAEFAGSSATHDHVVAEVLSEVTLDVGSGAVSWDDDLEVTASVAAAPSPETPAPTGAIVITDGTGTECVVPASGGTCALSWGDIGTRSLTAEYSGDATYAPAVSPTLEVDVTRRASSVLASVEPDPPVTGDSVRVRWEVPEHAGGEVTANIFGEACTGAAVGVCESVVLEGSSGSSHDVTVAFAGDERYLPSHVVLPVVPLQCHRLEVIGISADDGTVSFATPGNCNGGAGYLPGTAVKVVVTPAVTPDYDAVGVDWEGIGTTSGFVLDVFVGDGEGQVTLLRATLLRDWNCRTVDWVDSETVLNSLRTIGGALSITPAPNCPDGNAGWQRLDGFQRASFLAGTTLVATADAFPGMSFYGFQLGERTQVVDEDLSIQGLFGQTCIDLRVVTRGPGIAEAATATNCGNRLTDLRGFVPGSEVELVARADDGAHLTGWERTDDAGSEGDVFDEELRAQVVEWTSTVTVEDDPAVQSVAASFSLCSRIDIRFGSRFAGSEGHVERDRVGDCPTSDDPDLYRTGGEVHLEAVADVGVFGRWNHSDAESDTIRFLTVPTDDDMTLTPTFLASRVGCVAVDVRVAEGANALASTTTPSSPFCLSGSLADGPARELSGETHGPTDSLTFVGEATSGDPLLGWSFQAEWGSGGLRSVAGAIATPELPQRGTLDAVLDTCVAVVPEITLVYPDGRTETGSAPQGFVQLADPDRDAPDCQFQAYGGTWRVGSSTVLAPLVADGFDFVRWEGNVSERTDDLSEVAFDGSEPVLTVRAVYDVQCVNLTLRDPERTEFGPEPNCQPSGASAPSGPGGQYIVGTDVFLRATMPGGFIPRSDHQRNDSHVWQGWVGDVGGDRFRNPLAITMDQDRIIGFSYRETTFWEDAENVAYDAGDFLAESVRKTGGVMAMLAGEFLMGAGPMGAVTGVVSVLGATNSLLEFLGADTGDFASFVNDAQQTVDWVGSGFVCTAVWALDDGGAAEAVSDDDSAAASALGDLGGAEVAAGYGLDLATLANDAQIQSTNAIRTTHVIDDLAASRKAYDQSLRLQKGGGALDAFGDLMTVASVGVSLYDIADAGGANWADNTDAWTNPDVMVDCLESKMPDYLGIDTGSEVG